MRFDAESTACAPLVGGHTVRDAAKLVGLSEAQLRAFVRDGFVDPRRGRRNEYRLSFQDLVLLRTARELTGKLSARKVHRALRRLKEQLPKGRALASVRITAEGDEVVVRDGTQAWEPESGQGLLDFRVAELAETVEPVTTLRAQEALASEDLSADDWYDVGCELEECGSAQAVEAYRRCLELDPDHADSRVNLGRLLHEAGSMEEAERHYRRALDVRRTEVTAWFNLGVLLQDRGATDEAVRAYERVLELDSYFADAHYNLASLFDNAGDESRALYHYRAYRALLESGHA